MAQASTRIPLAAQQFADAIKGERVVTAKAIGGLCPPLCPPYMRFSGRLEAVDDAIDTPEETDVFRGLGLEWIDPRERK